MEERFGDMLRRLRQASGKSLGQLARAVEVTPVYVSDVERGRRNPLSTKKILQAAEFLEVDPQQLLTKARSERNVIQYDVTSGSELESEVVDDLVTRLARGGFSAETLRKIHRLVKEDS